MFVCYLFSVAVISLVFLVLVLFLSYTFSLSNSYTGSPFECGFQPFSVSGDSFSIPFFVISLMFLLFDVEIIILCFLPFGSSYFSSYALFWVLIFLVLGATCYEWLKGVLSWV